MHNVGIVDRVIRIIVGFIALIFALQPSIGMSAWASTVLIIVALILIVTGFVGICPIYSLFRINTCEECITEEELLEKEKRSLTGGRFGPEPLVEEKPKRPRRRAARKAVAKAKRKPVKKKSTKRKAGKTTRAKRARKGKTKKAKAQPAKKASKSKRKATKRAKKKTTRKKRK